MVRASQEGEAVGDSALKHDRAQPGTTIILGPKAAAEAVCHDEQMTVWSSDFTGMLNLGGWLRDDLSYADGVDLDAAIQRELRSIIEMAFDHPEAKTIKRGVK